MIMVYEYDLDLSRPLGKFSKYKKKLNVISLRDFDLDKFHLCAAVCAAVMSKLMRMVPPVYVSF